MRAGRLPGCDDSTRVSTIGAGWQEVGPGVFRCRYAAFDLNVGTVVGDDEILVVDTRGWRAQAGELRRSGHAVDGTAVGRGAAKLPVLAPVDPA
jgi:hypothetical protein